MNNINTKNPILLYTLKSVIAIVIPAFNPHEKWEKVLVDRFMELKNHVPAYDFRLYLVNDGSVINISTEEVSYIKSHIPDLVFIDHKANNGKGFALRNGIEKTTEEYIIYTDVDMPFTIHSMKSVIENISTHDVVFAIKKKEYYEQLPFQRKIVSKILQRFIKILFPALPVSDTQCGLKAMNEKGKNIFLQTTIHRYLFDLEFILYSSKNRLKIRAIPVELREGIVFGRMNYKILLHESKNLWKILKKK